MLTDGAIQQAGGPVVADCQLLKSFPLSCCRSFEERSTVMLLRTSLAILAVTVCLPGLCPAAGGSPASVAEAAPAPPGDSIVNPLRTPLAPRSPATTPPAETPQTETLPAQATDGLPQMYAGWLRSRGLEVEVRSDGTVVFRKDGGTYVIPVPQIEKDTSYFTLVYPSFWKITGQQERIRALEAANHATADTKVGKVYLVKDKAWATAEIFVASPGDFEAVFDRCMASIAHSRKLFIGQMRNEQATDSDRVVRGAPPAPPRAAPQPRIAGAAPGSSGIGGSAGTPILGR